MMTGRLKFLSVVVVCFSMMLGACAGARVMQSGEMSAEVSLEGGPAVQERGEQPPTAQRIQRAMPVVETAAATEGSVADECPVTEPTWVKPPEDAAVPDEPAYGYYYVNEDGSTWASAGWTEAEGYDLRAGKEGIKVGWFRPEGAKLEIAGQRLDAKAPALDAHVPYCYPTRFQATGLIFPTGGCWEVTARAEDSLISFVVWMEP